MQWSNLYSVIQPKVITPSKQTPSHKINSVERALSIMELLAAHPAGLNPKEVSLKLHLNLSTCYHQLNTLLATGYVVKNPETTLFQLSGKIGYTIHLQTSPAQLVKQLTAHTQALQEATQETAYLSIWDGQEIYIAAIVESSQSIRVKVLTIGYSGANHAMAVGKVILAYFDDDTLDHYLETHPLTPYTVNTITDKYQLKEHLIEVYQQGYSLDLAERLDDIFCIGVPIFDAQGQITASIGITVPETRFHSHSEQLLTEVQQAGHAATRHLMVLGYATGSV